MTVKPEMPPPGGNIVISKPKGRRPLPDELRRELLTVRILPSTRRALEAMPYENLGRAIDALFAVKEAH